MVELSTAGWKLDPEKLPIGVGDCVGCPMIKVVLPGIITSVAVMRLAKVLPLKVTVVVEVRTVVVELSVTVVVLS